MSSAPGRPRLVVVKPCCFGDVLMVTPLLEGLRKAYPAAHITVAVGRWSAPALDGNPDVDEVVLAPEPRSGVLSAVGSSLRLAASLRRLQADAILLPERSLVAQLGVLRSGARVRVGLARGWRRLLLTAARGWEEEELEVRSYYGLLPLLESALKAPGTSPTSPPLPRYQVSGGAREAVGQQWRRLAWSPDQPVLALAPGGGENPGARRLEKRWPLESWIALAGRAHAAWDCRLLLVGGRGDREPASRVAAAWPGAAWNACGELSWPQSAAALQRSRVLVANDSAPLHLAAAVGVPTVGVYGPTDPRVYAPPGPLHHSVGGEHGGRLSRREAGAETPPVPVTAVWARLSAAWMKASSH